jgi:8-oxo-dGTP pyrophosphatase MutT (NUDIX family)
MCKSQSACVVLINPEGLVLGVSRKDNHEDFGLIGGKMEVIDNDNPIFTAIRECKEETGLYIKNLELIFAIHKHGNMGFTYLAEYTGEINHDESHVVKWLPFERLTKGSFGRYNELVGESLIDKGVKFVWTL